MTIPRAAEYARNPDANRHEWLAITSLVLGIVAVLVGVLPVLFWLAGTLGFFALFLGLIARAPRKGKVGAALGGVAVVLAVIGLVIVVRSLNDFSDCVNKAYKTSAPVTDANGHLATPAACR